MIHSAQDITLSARQSQTASKALQGVGQNIGQSAGSIFFQLELRSALDQITAMTKRQQEQARENAQEEGKKAPLLPTF